MKKDNKKIMSNIEKTLYVDIRNRLDFLLFIKRYAEGYVDQDCSLSDFIASCKESLISTGYNKQDVYNAFKYNKIAIKILFKSCQNVLTSE